MNFEVSFPDGLSARELRGFQEALRAWFAKGAADHPWRQTRDPWAVLISEIMLQQTTVASVRAGRRFEKFLAAYPTPAALAAAPEGEILRAWEGLGYYNRVRNLQKCARQLTEEGAFPQTAAQWRELPGIGPYTAAAVASFAQGQRVAVIDGNVARVLSRLANDPTPIDTALGKQRLEERGTALLPVRDSATHSAALMELGQTHCAPRQPDCGACPVARWCRALDPETLPRKKPRAPVTEREEHAVLVLSGGRLLLARGQQSRRRGFYHLPLREGAELADAKLWGAPRTYVITRYRVRFFLYELSLTALPGGVRAGEEWVPLADLPELPLATPVRKALEEWLGELG